MCKNVDFVLDYAIAVNVLVKERNVDSEMGFYMFETYEDEGLYRDAKTDTEVEQITLREYDNRKV